MKTNIYRPVLIRILLFILISLYFITVFGQSQSSYTRESVVNTSFFQKYSSLNQGDYSYATLIGASNDVSLQARGLVPYDIIAKSEERGEWQTIIFCLYSWNHCFFPYNRRLNLGE